MNNQNLLIKYSFIKILNGSDLSRRHLPLMSAESKNSGPVVWLNGCIHGDEVGGMVVIQEIFKQIKDKLQNGKILAFPIMNPIGFETATRGIALSEEDLNRSFPGNLKGSLAERIARQIFSHIIQSQPSLVLDLHNDWTNSIPYALIESRSGLENNQVWQKSKNFAKKTKLINVLDSEKIDSSLTYNLIKNNIPALTLELGASYIVDEKNINIGLNAVWNVLQTLNMVKPLKNPDQYPISQSIKDKILTYSDKPYCSNSGIIRFLVKRGQIVKKNQKLARIYNAFGKLQETILAPQNSVILGTAEYSVVFPGTHIVALGIIN
ncbi:MAG: succinylglutamate desuccinylase/aspartoacylase family protein [bacterium]